MTDSQVENLLQRTDEATLAPEGGDGENGHVSAPVAAPLRTADESPQIDVKPKPQRGRPREAIGKEPTGESLLKMLPSDDMVAIYRRDEDERNGELVYQGKFRARDITGKSTIEEFIHDVIVRRTGKGGEYHLVHVKGDKRVSVGYVILENPVDAGMVSRVGELRELREIVREAVSERAQPIQAEAPKSILDQMAEIEELKKKLGGGDSSLAMMMMMQAMQRTAPIEPRRDATLDRVLMRLEAMEREIANPPPPPFDPREFLPREQPNPLMQVEQLATLLDRLRPPTPTVAPVPVKDAKTEMMEMRSFAESMGWITKPEEPKSRVREIMGEIQAYRELAQAVTPGESAQNFGDVLLGFMDRLPQSIESIAQLVEQVRASERKRKAGGNDHHEPEEPSDKIDGYPEGMKDHIERIRSAADDASRIQTVLTTLQFLGTDAEWRKKLMPVLQKARSGTEQGKKGTMAFLTKVLGELTSSGHIPSDTMRLSLEAIDKHWPKIVVAIGGKKPAEA